MIRNRATIASFILLAYVLIIASTLLWRISTTSLSVNQLLFSLIAMTLIVCAAASWGLWKQRLWGWQLASALVVIKLLFSANALLSLASTYSRLSDLSTNSSASTFVASYWKMLAITGIEIVVLTLFLFFLWHSKTRKLFSVSSEKIQNEQYHPISHIGLANIALATAFAVSALFSIGGKVLGWLLSEPLLRSIPPYQGHLFNVLANYWIPAFLFYLLFRLTRMGGWLNPNKAIQVLLGLSNVLFVLYVAARVFASTIQGGGPSFVVMQFSPLVVLPASALMTIGLAWLVVRVFQVPSRNWKFAGLGKVEMVMILIAFAIPSSYVASFYLAEDGAFRLAQEANKVFKEKCALSGEVLPQKPIGEVQGIYLERDGDVRFGVKNGVVTDQGAGILGEPLVNSGWLLFFETNNQNGRDGEQLGKFKKYSFVDGRKWEYGDTLSSQYAVLVTEMVKDVDPRLQVGGAKISIVDRATNETLASTTYFFSRRNGKFCGAAPRGYFDSGEFIRRALGLKMQYPSAYSPPNVQQKPTPKESISQ